MIYKIIVEPEAFQDLMSIKIYITKQDSFSKANKFISELKRILIFSTTASQPHPL